MRFCWSRVLAKRLHSYFFAQKPLVFFVFFFLKSYIACIINCFFLHLIPPPFSASFSKQFCVQSLPLDVRMLLFVFAAEHWCLLQCRCCWAPVPAACACSAPTAVDWYLLPKGCSAKSAAVPLHAAVDCWDRQTDIQPLHRPCSTYCAGSINNTEHHMVSLTWTLYVDCLYVSMVKLTRTLLARLE